MTDHSTHPAIVLDQIEKYYPPPRTGVGAYFQPFERASHPALQGLSLSIQAGEAVALLGSNGAGKSTLLRILATLLLPTRGQAAVAGYDVAAEPRAVRRQLGYHAGSDLGFYPRLTGRQNLLFFGQLNHLSPSQAAARVAELSSQFHLRDALDQQVRTLSSGTTQRLSLARALLHQPRVLLLDEPTRSLDAVAAAEFRRFLAGEVLLRERTTVLFASHSLSEIESLAHRVAVLEYGRLVTFDTVPGLLAATSTSNLEQAFFALTRSARLQSDQESHQ